MKGKWLAIGSLILSMAMQGSAFAEDKDRRATRKTVQLPNCVCVMDAQKKTCRFAPPKGSTGGCVQKGTCSWPTC